MSLAHGRSGLSVVRCLCMHGGFRSPGVWSDMLSVPCAWPPSGALAHHPRRSQRARLRPFRSLPYAVNGAPSSHSGGKRPATPIPGKLADRTITSGFAGYNIWLFLVLCSKSLHAADGSLWQLRCCSTATATSIRAELEKAARDVGRHRDRRAWCSDFYLLHTNWI